MRITLPRHALVSAAQAADKAAPRKGVTPVVEGALIEAHPAGATIATNAYDITMRADLYGATVFTPGRALVNARRLAEIASKLPKRGRGPEPEATVTTEGTMLVIACGKSSTRLPTLPVGDHPDMPTLPQSVGGIDADALIGLMGSVAPAAGGAKVFTATFDAVRLSADGGRLQAMASDRSRACVRTIDGWHGAAFTALVNAKTLVTLASGFKGAGTVQVTVDDGRFGLVADARSVTARNLIDEVPMSTSTDDDGNKIEFNAWTKLAELVAEALDTPTTTFDVDVADVREAVQAVSVCAARLSGGRAQPIEVRYGDGRVEFAVNQLFGDLPAGVYVQPAYDGSGEAVLLRLDPSFLLTTVKTLGAARVRVSYRAKSNMVAVGPVVDGRVPADAAWWVLVHTKTQAEKEADGDVPATPEETGSGGDTPPPADAGAVVDAPVVGWLTEAMKVVCLSCVGDERDGVPLRGADTDGETCDLCGGGFHAVPETVSDGDSDTVVVPAADVHPVDVALAGVDLGVDVIAAAAAAAKAALDAVPVVAERDPIGEALAAVGLPDVVRAAAVAAARAAATVHEVPAVSVDVGAVLAAVDLPADVLAAAVAAGSAAAMAGV